MEPDERSSDTKERAALAAKLKSSREYLGFSQDEVAAHVGISRSALSNIETGQRKVEAIELKKFARLYKRPLSYFADDYSPDEVHFGEDVAHLARQVASLSDTDRAELKRFAEYLRLRRQSDEDADAE